MKVKELIEELKKLDQEKEICINDCEYGEDEIDLRLNIDKTKYYL